MKQMYIGVVAIMMISQISIAADAEPTSEPEHRGMVSAFVGPSIPTSSGGQGSTVFGARLGTQLGQDQWAKGHIGLVIGTTSITTSISGLTEVDTATFILGEYLARQSFGTGLYFGARAGVSLLSSNITGSGTNLNGSASAFAFAPVVGYEIPLAKQIDLNLDLSWLTRMATSMTIPGLGTVNAPTGQSVLLLGGLNYHF